MKPSLFIMVFLTMCATFIFCEPALAQFTATTGTAIGVGAGDTTDLAKIVENGLLPTIAEIAVTLICAVGLWLAKKLDTLTGLKTEDTVRSIEATHRDALQSAVTNAAGAALAKYGPTVKIDSSTPAGQMVANIVKASVPDAVAVLGATNDWIMNTASAKLALSVPPATPAAGS